MNAVEKVQRWADDLQRRHSAFGLPYAVVKKYGDDGGYREAALITYYGFLSLFPILLLAVWVISRVLVGNPQLSADLISAIVPADLQTTVTSAVAALPQSGVPVVIGLVGLLFSGLGVVGSSYHTLNHLVGIPHRERFDFFPRYLRWFAALLVLLLGAVAIGGLSVMAAFAATLPAVGDLLSNQTTTAAVGAVGSVLVTFGLLLVVARLLVCRPVRFAAVWPAALLGALIVTAVLTIGGQVFAIFVQRAGPVYGTFATVVGFFSLLYIANQGLVYSAEFAIVRRRRLWPRSLDATRPTAADRRVYRGLAREQERIPPQRVSARFDAPPEQG